MYLNSRNFHLKMHFCPATIFRYILYFILGALLEGIKAWLLQPMMARARRSFNRTLINQKINSYLSHYPINGYSFAVMGGRLTTLVLVFQGFGQGNLQFGSFSGLLVRTLIYVGLIFIGEASKIRRLTN